MIARDPKLTVTGVSVDYLVSDPGSWRRRRFRAVDSVSLEVAEGESVGIVGESGSGKTTLARAIAGLVQPSDGQIRVSGIPQGRTPRASASMRHGRVGMVFQDPYSSLNPRQPIGAAIGEPIAVHGLRPDKESKERRVHELLDLVGLSPAVSDRYPSDFSGGQRQRIAIARALAAEPELLVCDEPTSALDVSIQAQVLRLLRELQSDLDLTLVIVSHDLGVVAYACDRVAVMCRGRLVESGPTSAILGAPQHDYTRSLLHSYPVMTREVPPTAQITKHQTSTGSRS